MTRAVQLLEVPAAAVPWRRYTLETLLTGAGLAWRWCRPESVNPNLPRVVLVEAAGTQDVDGELVIPVGSLDDFCAGAIAVKWIDDVPVLHARSQPAPASLWQDHRLACDLLTPAFYALARLEEHRDTHRDLWGTFAGSFSVQHELGLLNVPFVDLYSDVLAARLAALPDELRVARRHPWPGAAPFAVALTHDCDYLHQDPARPPRLYRARSLRELVRHVKANREFRRRVLRGEDPYGRFDAWVDLERRYGATSTFYWAAEIQGRHKYDPSYSYNDRVAFRGKAMRLRDLLPKLHDEGFEIGLHGSYMSHCDALRLGDERRRLSAVLGAPALGVRQHFLRFAVEATWQNQQRAGFSYDSTLGYNECEGFRAGSCRPFRPFDLAAQVPIDLWEIGLHLYEKIFVGDTFYKLNLDKALRRFTRMVDTVSAMRGCLTLLWHPNAWDGALFPLQRLLYERALELLATRGAWLCSGLGVARRWSEHARALSGGEA